MFDVSPEIDLNINQGVDWTKDFIYYSDALGTTPVDFATATGKCQIRDVDGTVVATPVVSFPGNGVVRLTLTATATSAIPCDGLSYDVTTTHYYDVEIVRAGVKDRWANGKVIVSPEVTKI